MEAGDGEYEQHDRRRIRARRLQGGEVGVDLVPEAGVDAARRGLRLRDVGADYADGKRDARSAEGRRQRGRQLGEAERLPARGVERAHQLQLVGVHRGEAVDRRDEHRKEADDHDHHELGEHAEAPPEDQKRRDHGDRDGLRADRQGIHRAAKDRREMDQHREHEAEQQRQQDPEPHLLGRGPEVCREQPGVVPHGGGDRVGGRQHEGAVRARIDVDLPQRRAARPRAEAAAARPGARPGRARRPARAGACALTLVLARAGLQCEQAERALAQGDDSGVVRARGRSAATSSSSITRPGRGERIRRARRAGSPPRRRGSRARRCAARARAPPHQACISARVIASSAPNGSSRHSTGLPESSVRRKATRWRMPPESSGARPLEALQPELLEQRAARRRACRARQPRDRSASAALSRRSARQQKSCWGISTAGAHAIEPPSGRAARRSARAACSCRSRSAPPPRPARRGRRTSRSRRAPARLGDRARRRCGSPSSRSTAWPVAPCGTGVCGRTFSSVATSLPSRALPHRF